MVRRPDTAARGAARLINQEGVPTVVKPDLNPSSTFMIIGEAPGKTELSEGRCFVGASGRVTWAVAGECGIRRVDCDVTNVVMSPPLGKSGNPTPSQISEERPRFMADMAASQARVLILLGGIALRAVMGKQPKIPGSKCNLNSITDMRGYLLKPEDAMGYQMREKVKVRDGEYKTSRKGRYQKGDPKFKSVSVTKTYPAVLPPNCEWIIATLHPSAIMRMNFKTIPAFKADLDRAARASRGELNLVNPDALPETSDPIIAIDIETPMPPNDWVIEQVGWSFMGKAFTAPWEQAAYTIKKYMGSGENVIAFHNAAFDLPRIEK